MIPRSWRLCALCPNKHDVERCEDGRYLCFDCRLAGLGKSPLDDLSETELKNASRRGVPLGGK